MIDKRVETVTKTDVEDLVQSGRIEDRTVEYKRDLPGGSDDDRREFLKDVSSFANAQGGDLLYGIDEDSGVPTGAPGVPVANFDELRLRLQNMVQSNLDPRIPGMDIVEIPGFPDGSVVMIRVQASWRAPHMITFKNLSKFYIRGNGQNIEMDVTQLRSAFVGSEAIADRIRRFRDERIALLLSGRSPMKQHPLPTLMVHVLPVGAAFIDSVNDARTIGTNWTLLNREGELPALVYSAAARPNLDGLLVYSSSYSERANMTPTYVQVFRNGGVEFVRGYNLSNDGATFERPPYLEAESLEAEILDIVRNAAAFRMQLALGGAVLVSVSLVRVEGLPMQRGRGLSRTTAEFDREVIVLPDVVIDTDDQNSVEKAIRPIFEALWQAAGFNGSDSYDVSGEYVRKKIR